MDDLLYINKGRGKVLLHGGYQYYKNRDYIVGGEVWRCSRRVNGKYSCTGSLTLKGSTIIKNKNHKDDCVPNFGKNVIDFQLHECKKELASSADFSLPVKRYYKKAEKKLKDQGIHLIADFPEFKSVKNTLYNARNKGVDMDKVNFDRAEDVKISPKFHNMVLGDYYDSNDGVRIIVLCDQKLQNVIPEFTHFFGDGTFRSCPKPFSQIYVICADVNSSLSETNVFPVIYALMTHMSKTAYIILFEIIKSQIPTWNPLKFTSDYEEAARSAIVEAFPKITLKGCFFHFKNAIWRKAKAIGVTKAKWSKNKVNLARSLPLLPREYINEGWQYVKMRMSIMSNTPAENNALSNNKTKKFITYMENYWLKDEKFIDSWCIYSERHRTTNIVESWNKKLNASCNSRRKVNIIQLLQILKDDAEETISNLFKIRQGKKISSRQIDSVNNDNEILEAQLQLVNKEITVGFLRINKIINTLYKLYECLITFR